MTELVTTALRGKMAQRLANDSPDKSKVIQSLTNLRVRLQGMIALMNAPTAPFDGPALRVEVEQWVRDLSYARLILEIVEGFRVPSVTWEQDEVAFLNEWNAFLPKACMALIDEQNRYRAAPSRH